MVWSVNALIQKADLSFGVEQENTISLNQGTTLPNNERYFVGVGHEYEKLVCFDQNIYLVKVETHLDFNKVTKVCP